MRHFGTRVYGVRTPIINKGDDLAEIVADSVAEALKNNGMTLSSSDVLGITEAVVAKSQGNYATFDDIACDVKKKFGGKEVGVVLPIMSRNRFMGILKGISRGAEKVCVLLSYPNDEFGNPVIDREKAYELEDKLTGLITAEEFRKAAGEYPHPFTGVDYLKAYGEAGDNISVYLSRDCRDILKLTKNVIAADIHTREFTRRILLKAGAERVFTLADILAEPVNGSGYNPVYGVMGSNLSTEEALKLFPRPKECEALIESVRKKLRERTGVTVEALVYGDGAFKDPFCGIWELADPVVSPAYTPRLGGRPNEIKIKFVADNNLAGLSGSAKDEAVKQMLKQKSGDEYSLGTTPRKYADLLGSLCDLTSGSGDKGTPVILIQGYFDDYSAE